MKAGIARLLYQHVHVDGTAREDVEAHVRRSLAYAKRHYATNEARERFNRPGWYAGGPA